MISFIKYLNEGVKGDTSENVIRIIKNLCHKDFKFVESTRYGDDVAFLIKSVDGNVTIRYESKKNNKFDISIFSQNLNETNMEEYAKFISKTSILVSSLEQLDKARRFEILEKSRG